MNETTHPRVLLDQNSMILSRAIYSVIILLGGLVAYQVYWNDQESWRWGILPVVMLLILNYVFSSEIDEWWELRQPTVLDPREHRFLKHHSIFYRALLPVQQKEFGEDCLRFHRRRDYIFRGIPSFPEDLKALFGAQALKLQYILGLDTELLAKFEKVVLYSHPFISPSIDYVHTSETHEEDGVWLFSTEQLILGLTRSRRFFNIALYEMARVQLQRDAQLAEELDNWSDEQLEEWRSQLTGFSMEKIQKWINIEAIDVRAAYITTLLDHWHQWALLSQERRARFPLSDRLEKTFRISTPDQLSR